MPIYEYQCRSCGAETEKLQRLNAPQLTDCPVCGRTSLSRKISAAGFRLKGGGWYETDFKNRGKKNVAGEASTSEAKSSEAGASTAADAACGKPGCGSGVCAA